MVRSRAPSPPARAILAALLEAGSGWSHGYALARAANVRSGTLYPMLIRLEEQGYLEAQWQEAEGGGRPPRHAYRLTARGVQLARDYPSEPAPAACEATA